MINRLFLLCCFLNLGIVAARAGYIASVNTSTPLTDYPFSLYWQNCSNSGPALVTCGDSPYLFASAHPDLRADEIGGDLSVAARGIGSPEPALAQSTINFGGPIILTAESAGNWNGTLTAQPSGGIVFNLFGNFGVCTATVTFSIGGYSQSPVDCSHASANLPVIPIEFGTPIDESFAATVLATYPTDSEVSITAIERLNLTVQPYDYLQPAITGIHDQYGNNYQFAVLPPVFTPEPSSLGLFLSGLVVCFVKWVQRQRRSAPPQGRLTGWHARFSGTVVFWELSVFSLCGPSPRARPKAG
jgi:hypothetical protein